MACSQCFDRGIARFPLRPHRTVPRCIRFRGVFSRRSDSAGRSSAGHRAYDGTGKWKSPHHRNGAPPPKPDPERPLRLASLPGNSAGRTSASEGCYPESSRL